MSPLFVRGMPVKVLYDSGLAPKCNIPLPRTFNFAAVGLCSLRAKKTKQRKKKLPKPCPEDVASQNNRRKRGKL